MKNDFEIKTFLRQSFQSLWTRKQRLSQAGIMFGARAVGLGFGAVGSVWAARCLGPHNLGVSGMVQNFVSQVTILFGAIYFTLLIREYKHAHSNAARDEIVRATTTFRFAGALFFCVIAALGLGFGLFPDEYQFAGWFFIPILLVNALQPDWVFQAAEKQHFQSVISTLQSALKAGLYLFLFRAGMSASADLSVITTVGVVLMIIYWAAIYRLTPMKGSILDLGSLGLAWKLVVKSRWLFLSSLSAYVFMVLEQPLLGWLYSVDELGQYRTSVTVASVAESFLAIIPTILYPRFIEWSKLGPGILWRRQLKLAVFLTVSGLVAIAAGAVLIPFFYPMVFGVVFTRAAIPCAILVASKIVVVIAGIFYWGLLTDEKHDRFVLKMTMSIAVFSLTCNILLIPKWGMYAAYSVNLASEVILLVICLWASVRKARGSGPEYYRSGSKG